MSLTYNYPIYEFHYPDKNITQQKVLIPHSIYEQYNAMPYDSKEDQASAKVFLNSHTDGMEWFTEKGAYFKAIYTGFVEANGKYPVVVKNISL